MLRILPSLGSVMRTPHFRRGSSVCLDPERVPSGGRQPVSFCAGRCRLPRNRDGYIPAFCLRLSAQSRIPYPTITRSDGDARTILPEPAFFHSGRARPRCIPTGISPRRCCVLAMRPHGGRQSCQGIRDEEARVHTLTQTSRPGPLLLVHTPRVRLDALTRRFRFYGSAAHLVRGYRT